MKILSFLAFIFLLTGCVSARQTSGLSAISAPQSVPAVKAVAPAAPTTLSVLPKPVSVPVSREWSNEDSWNWTSGSFPKPGDSVRLFRDIGDYVSGTVTKSEAKTDKNLTTVWLMLDTNQNRKDDLWIKVLIDSENPGEIRTKFSEVEEK